MVVCKKKKKNPSRSAAVSNTPTHGSMERNTPTSWKYMVTWTEAILMPLKTSLSPCTLNITSFFTPHSLLAALDSPPLHGWLPSMTNKYIATQSVTEWHSKCIAVRVVFCNYVHCVWQYCEYSNYQMICTI